MSNHNWLLLLLLAAFWGASFLFTSLGLQSVDYLPLVTYRITFAAITLWIIARIQAWQIPKGKIWFYYFLVGSFMCSFPFSLIVWGQQYIPSGLAGILNASTAIFGAALAPFFFADERLRWNKALGVLIGFSGIIVSIGVDNLRDLDPYNLGQWAVVGATLCYGIGGVLGKKLLHAHKPQVNALGMVSTAALAMLLALILNGQGQRLVPDFQGIVSIFYLATVGTAFAYMLYYYLLSTVGVANVTLVTLIIPVFAIFLGAAILGEKLHIHEFIGFALLALGLIIIDGRVFSGNEKRTNP